MWQKCLTLFILPSTATDLAADAGCRDGCDRFSSVRLQHGCNQCPAKCEYILPHTRSLNDKFFTVHPSIPGVSSDFDLIVTLPPLTYLSTAAAVSKSLSVSRHIHIHTDTSVTQILPVQPGVTLYRSSGKFCLSSTYYKSVCICSVISN